MVCTVGELIEYIKTLGFVQQQRRHGGSHKWSFKHEDGRVVKFAGEKTKILGIGLLNALCEQAEIDFAAAKLAIWI